jgi:hypothetical protein
MLTDYANPLSSWELVFSSISGEAYKLILNVSYCSIEDVISSGKAHGTTREDLYGCLYFHVTDQLRDFIDRLARFNVSLKVFNKDTVDFSREITRNELSSLGIDSSTRFDRIEVSNIMDVEYVGVTQVIDSWGKFLKKAEDATLLGYFMNWPAHQPGAEPYKDNRDITQSMKRLSESGRVRLFLIKSSS